MSDIEEFPFLPRTCCAFGIGLNIYPDVVNDGILAFWRCQEESAAARKKIP